MSDLTTYVAPPSSVTPDTTTTDTTDTSTPTTSIPEPENKPKWIPETATWVIQGDRGAYVWQDSQSGQTVTAKQIYNGDGALTDFWAYPEWTKDKAGQWQPILKMRAVSGGRTYNFAELGSKQIANLEPAKLGGLGLGNLGGLDTPAAADPAEALYSEYWDGEAPPKGYIEKLRAEGLNTFEMEELWRQNPAWQRTQAFQNQLQASYDGLAQFFGFTPGMGRWAPDGNVKDDSLAKVRQSPGYRQAVNNHNNHNDNQDNTPSTGNGQSNVRGDIGQPNARRGGG